MPAPTYDWATPMPVLQANRVRLRPLRDEDVRAVFEVFSDPEAMRYWSSPALTELTQARDLIERIHQGFSRREFLQWGIADRATDALLGTVTLWKPDFEHARCELGFALRRDRWGQGLATEAVRAALAFAFTTMGMNRIEADVDPRNFPSLALLERIGFTREGVLRQRYFLHDEWQDSVVFALLRSEWS